MRRTGMADQSLNCNDPDLSWQLSKREQIKPEYERSKFKKLS
jgi:hypothetical protein